MRVSRQQAEKNRAHVVEVASGLFRARGLDGVGIADLMKAAGLTHGAFYGQFQSKEQLAAEALGHAMGATRDRWEQLAATPEGAHFDHIARLYLSMGHRARAGDGCAMAALGPDVARAADGVRDAFEDGLQAALAVLARAMGGDDAVDPRKSWDAAAAAFSTMVGALVLARAVKDDDTARRILAAAASHLGVSTGPEDVAQKASQEGPQGMSRRVREGVIEDAPVAAPLRPG